MDTKTKGETVNEDISLDFWNKKQINKLLKMSAGFMDYPETVAHRRELDEAFGLKLRIKEWRRRIAEFRTLRGAEAASSITVTVTGCSDCAAKDQEIADLKNEPGENKAEFDRLTGEFCEKMTEFKERAELAESRLDFVLGDKFLWLLGENNSKGLNALLRTLVLAMDPRKMEEQE